MAFRTPVLLRLLLDLDTNGGVDPLGVFSQFLKMVADINSGKLSIIFCGLIRLGSFPECWRSANVSSFVMLCKIRILVSRPWVLHPLIGKTTVP